MLKLTTLLRKVLDQWHPPPRGLQPFINKVIYFESFSLYFRILSLISSQNIFSFHLCTNFCFKHLKILITFYTNQSDSFSSISSSDSELDSPPSILSNLNAGISASSSKSSSKTFFSYFSTIYSSS